MTKNTNHVNSIDQKSHNRTTHSKVNRGDKVQFYKKGKRYSGEVANIISYDAGRTWIVVDTGTNFKNVRPCFIEVLTQSGES